MRLRRGFTLIELLLVIGVVGVLASIVIVAINPGKQLQAAEDVRRSSNANQLAKAFEHHFIDTWEPILDIPEGEENAVPLCRAGITDPSCVNVDVLVPTFIVALPVDVAETNPLHTGYSAYRWYGRHNVVALHLGLQSGESSSASSLASSSAASSAPPPAPTDVIAWWKLDAGNGTQAVDSSGNGYNGTIVNMAAAAWTATTAPLDAANPYALDFDRDNDYVSVPSNAALSAFGKTALTVSAWIRPDGAGENGEGRIVDKGGHTSLESYQGYTLTLYNGGATSAALAASSGYGTTAALTVSPATAITYGGWHHVTFVYNAAGDKRITLYLDGQALTASTQNAGVGAVSDDRIIDLRIGNYPGGTVRTFDGIIDDVRIFDRALGTSEIAALADGR